MATLGLTGIQVKGFEEDAYGAALCLINFRLMTPKGRRFFDAACIKAKQKAPGQGMLTYKQAYFEQLRQLRTTVFFSDTSDLGIMSNAVNFPYYPWTLLSAVARGQVVDEFSYCYQQVLGGNIPQLSGVTAPDIISCFEINPMLSGALTVFSPILAKVIQGFIVRVLPETAAMVGEIMAPFSGPLLIGSVALGALNLATSWTTLQDLKRTYAIDRERRLHLLKAKLLAAR